MAKKKPPQNPVLDEHFPIFQRYIDKWQPILNLNDYRIDLIKKRSAHMAELEVNSAARVASLMVGNHFGGDPVNDETIEATVLHELLHLRNHAVLVEAYEQREYNEIVEAAEHSQIYVFERLLMRLLGDKPAAAPAATAPEVQSAPRSDP